MILRHITPFIPDKYYAGQWAGANTERYYIQYKDFTLWITWNAKMKSEYIQLNRIEHFSVALKNWDKYRYSSYISKNTR